MTTDKENRHASAAVPAQDTAESWSAPYIELLDDCERRESRLTDWERGFVDSLRSQIERDRRPSAKQIETLDSIWERVTARG